MKSFVCNFYIQTETFVYIQSLFSYAYNRARWTGLVVHSGPQSTGSNRA